MINFIIHPGIVKTGTTFFQYNIIPKINSSLNVGKPYDNKISKKIKKIFYQKNKQKKEIYKVSEMIFKYHNKNQINNIIFSDEMILDSEFYNTRSNLENINELITQLKRKFKLKVFILITTRSQEKLIMSRYSYIFPLFQDKYNSINDYVEKNLNFNSDFFKNLKFISLEKKLKKIFKVDTIFLPLEFLENDKKKYLKVLNSFLFRYSNNKRINFSKINHNSKDNVFFVRKKNIWYKIYLNLYKLLNFKLVKYIVSFSKINHFFYKKIKFKKTDERIDIDINTIKKIRNYYRKDNILLHQKYGIKYFK